MRIKNRLKKLIPGKVRKYLRKGKEVLRVLNENPKLIKKGVTEVKRNGVRAAIKKAKSKVISSKTTSAYTIEGNLINIEVIKSEINQFQTKPLISVVVPVYNVEPKWLERAIQSVEDQYYE
ncbi:hypothetical protein GNF78_18420, partial [Clostridium perfringens]